MLRATDLSYQYPSSSAPDLEAGSLDIPRGQLMVSQGPRLRQVDTAPYAGRPHPETRAGSAWVR